ncbi:MAG: tetratricopeptide repeat protein [Pseudomonadota bacterium]
MRDAPLGSLVFCFLAVVTLLELSGPVAWPLSREVILENGIRDFQEKRFENAVLWFTQLIEMEPFSAKAYKNRAAAHMELGHTDEAIRDLTSAINLEPELQGLQNNLGVAWYSKKEYQKAIESYTREIELNPDRFTTYFNRAMALTDSGDNAKALEDLAMVMKLAPDNYMALSFMGDVLGKAGKKDEAINAFKSVLKIDPGNDYAPVRLKELEAGPSQVKPGKPEAAPAPSIPKNPEPGPAREPAVQAVTVQTGAFRDPDNARDMADRLKRSGYKAEVVKLPGSGSSPWYLVRIGSFTDRNRAIALVRELKSMAGLTSVIRPAGSL